MSLRLGSPDYRRLARRASLAASARPALVSMVHGTFAEMPGLQITLPEATRFFQLDEETCRVVFNDLEQEGVLRRSARNTYVMTR